MQQQMPGAATINAAAAARPSHGLTSPVSSIPPAAAAAAAAAPVGSGAAPAAGTTVVAVSGPRAAES